MLIDRLYLARRFARFRWPSLLVCVTAAFALLVSTATAGQAMLMWASPFQIAPVFEGSGRGEALVAISCLSAFRSTALESSDGEVTFEPTRPEGAISAMPFGAGQPSALACPSISQCTDTVRPGVEFTFDPFAPEMPTAVRIDEAGGVSALSCPSVTQCTAVDETGGEVTFDPESPTSPTRYEIAEGGSGARLTALACPSVSQCTAVGGSSAVTFDPASPSTRTLVTVDQAGELVGVACPAITQCTAVDSSRLAASFNPSSAGAVESSTIAEPKRAPLVSIACLSQSACYAFTRELEMIEEQPFGAAGASVFLDGTDHLSALTCVFGLECVAVDEGGHEVLGVPDENQHAPVSIDGPSISVSGHPRVGETLSAGAGTWSNAPSAYSYFWEDCNGEGLGCT